MKVIRICFFMLLILAMGCKEETKNGVVDAEKETTKEELALKPPLGWNSFDSYGVYLYEEAAMENLKAMSEKLQPHGYEYFVIDNGWFGEYELQEGTKYSKEKHAADIRINEYGIVQPSKTYFPNGIKRIADEAHRLGLKFGIHLMRGIPRKAYEMDTPIKDTEYTARQIADTTSICRWCDYNYGVDMSRPGAQEFYNSLVNQMAEWGVDYLKVDDIVPFPKEVEAVAKAVEQADRPMVLSLSPGGKVNPAALDFFKKANLLRVTPDIWDEQEGIDQCFIAWEKWNGKSEAGFWIDMDMIPFGQLQIMSPKPEDIDMSHSELREEKGKGKLDNVALLSGKGWNRRSEFTKDQMRTFITMRALSASPLMVGGDLPTMDDFSLSLLTNKEMLACNQNGIMGELALETADLQIWGTPDKDSEMQWIGIFNRTREVHEIVLEALLAHAKIVSGEAKVLDIWNAKEIDVAEPLEIGANGVLFIKMKL